jgi:hypothetical protein
VLGDHARSRGLGLRVGSQSKAYPLCDLSGTATTLGKQSY